MLLYVLSLIGVAVFSVSGALEAGRKKFDLMGVLTVALVTSIGGGTIRDVLLNHYPVFWIHDTNYLLAAISAAVLTFACSRSVKPPFKFLLIADGLGLALFSIAGTQLAEQAGVGTVVAILMGTITGVAGGLIRDVLCGEVPLLFRPSEPLYATAAIAGATAYMLLGRLGAEQLLSSLLGMLVVALMRFAAVIFSLRLPMFKADWE